MYVLIYTILYYARGYGFLKILFATVQPILTIHNSSPKQIRNFSINFKIKSKILPPDFMEPCRVRCKRIRNNFRHFCANFSEKDVQGSLPPPPPLSPKFH